MNPIHDYLQNNLPSYLDILQRMVCINSFTANAKGVNAVGELTAEVFASLGFQAEFVQSSNPAYGRHLFLTHRAAGQPEGEKLSGKTIAMVSHLDTVFPPAEEQRNNFTWRRVGDHIYGPGTNDIKGGTVMIYMVLDALRTLAPEYFDAINWLIGLDGSEEALSDDFGELCLERMPAETLACLVFEGGTPNARAFQLVVARKGRATFEVNVQGRSAHAGNNHALGANAILQIAHTIQQIEALTDYEKKLTFNVGTISGGSVVNRVPHFAVASVEMRAFSPDIYQAGVQRMLALNGAGQVVSTDGYACQVSVQLASQSTPWPRNAATDQLYDLWSEAADGLGMYTKIEERGGLSDGNLIWQRVPTLDGLGPVGDNAHCSEQSADGSKEAEYVEISSFVPKAMLNATAVMKLIEE